MSRRPISLLGTVQGSYRVISVDGSESTTGNHSPRYLVECCTCKAQKSFTKQHLRVLPQCLTCNPAQLKAQLLVGERIGSYDVIALDAADGEGPAHRRRYTVRCVECQTTLRLSKARLMAAPTCQCQTTPPALLTPLRRPAALAKARLVQLREAVSPATTCGTWLWLHADHPQYEGFRADARKVKRAYQTWWARQKAPDLSGATFVNSANSANP